MSKDEIAEWRAMARAWVLKHMQPGRQFSGNDIWANGLPTCKNRRLLGSVLLGLEKDGLLRRHGKTTSEGGHGQSIKLWSLA